ncbi:MULTISPECIES: hypothetical protein [Virgibacillus]|uniref:Uncharacterized protein n=2 Tax=Virgibacillus TaxID=84406 RepID=A0A024QAK9_9BACI|nr:MULTISPECIES: hypothetical protein [Virgibacillus]EQB35658.1 hypothetical protein M948_11485 [Virgibacillus sp. CM-4]MYL41461.1 hypothetical protein [Virgibacillus massiliensis]GGJ50685.1 hypothetical protein GCM10007111_11250 [Virgibacillus kapii]CDQ39265.1 hypothetical protein BN990_01559 [Virgibacillus massiliensis]
MQKNGVWLPIIASVGVGAATYYTMTKNNQNLGQTMQQMIPFVSQMTNSNNSSGNSGNTSTSNSQQLGPYGMS